MSFILDALKKIEEDKRRREARETHDVVALERARGSSSRLVLVMVTIAAASAAVTASVLLLRRGAETSVEGAGRGQAAESASLERVADVDVASPAAEASAAAEPRSPATGESAAAPAPSLEPVATGQIPSPEPAASAPQSEPVPSIRLVGRESPRLYGDSSALALVGDDDPTEAEEPLPEHFPELVLQGTSVIDGEPVAVINDQRVFEGDRVEGARILAIEERTVELELEGVRFKIRL